MHSIRRSWFWGENRRHNPHSRRHRRIDRRGSFVAGWQKGKSNYAVTVGDFSEVATEIASSEN